MALPDTYSELYPGRFLKADMLKGRKVTLTIKGIVLEDLIGETGKPAAKVVVSFIERPLELVLPKTNGECLKRMFGNNPNHWIGKKITLFPTTTRFGSATVDCIRIWGSPEIDADMDISIPQGRRKALEMTMHKVTVKNGNEAAPSKPPAQAIDPRLATAFEILDWTPAEQAAYLTRTTNLGVSDALSELNRLIDERAVQEA